jgi:hypothetical protein
MEISEHDWRLINNYYTDTNTKPIGQAKNIKITGGRSVIVKARPGTILVTVNQLPSVTEDTRPIGDIVREVESYIKEEEFVFLRELILNKYKKTGSGFPVYLSFGEISGLDDKGLGEYVYERWNHIFTKFCKLEKISWAYQREEGNIKFFV